MVPTLFVYQLGLMALGCVFLLLCWLWPNAAYGVVHPMARSRVTPKLMARHWDAFRRVAGARQQGTGSASERRRSLRRSTCPSALARAIGAVGRIPWPLSMVSDRDEEP